MGVQHAVGPLLNVVAQGQRSLQMLQPQLLLTKQRLQGGLSESLV